MKVLFDKTHIDHMMQQFQNDLHIGKTTDNIEGNQRHKYLQDAIGFLENFYHLLDAIDTSIIVAATDNKGKVLYVNDKFCEISKYSRDELIGKTHRILNSGHHSKSFFREMWETITNGDVWEGEIKNRAKDGSYYWVKTTIVPIKDGNGKPVMFISLRTDISEGKLAQEKKVQALENDFQSVLNSMYNLIFKVKRDHQDGFMYTLAEGKLAYQLGIKKRDAIYLQTPYDIPSKKISKLLISKYEKAFQGEKVTYTYNFQGKSLLTHLTPLYNGDDIVEIIGWVNDVTELNHAQAEVEFMAYHDILTNLPNRRMFNEDMTDLVSRGQKFAVLFLDIDRFKQINDSLGHTIGDMLIQEVSTRLQILIAGQGKIYRFAGDEFIIVLSNIDRNDELLDRVEQILSHFNEMFVLSNKQHIYVTPSIGISVYPDHGRDYDTLLKNADTAMFVAKSFGRNMFKLYEPQMNQNHEEALTIEQYLRQAIEKDEFELYFQPKMELATERLTSMEALIRWKHPILGDVRPDKFISIAEETGLIINIDEWVLESACRQNKIWNDLYPSSPMRMAVNISPLHFRLPNFVELVERTLRKTGLSPELLEIEITEGSFIDNIDECISILSRLRSMGVSVAVDDFGIGYSSLNYLRRFPISSLKIDRTFIQEITENKGEIAIVKAIIYLSHELNLRVVAEGTETKEVIELLKDLGCDEVQGYYISKPLPKEEFEQNILKVNQQMAKPVMYS
jgi:diguanylate cyclase (GGDEF)-like protein/PAS domain S-box-containing protein